MKKIFLLLITNLLLFLPVKSDTNINSIYEGNKDDENRNNSNLSL